jgi:outer membrane protein OmpA-like peptidoglycan-associated protein
MRILYTGIAAFVIWSFFSTWLYVDVLRHAAKPTVAVQAIQETPDIAADSLAKLYAMMPQDLTIYYEFDKFRFVSDPQIETSLTEFKSWLGKHPESVLTVTGYTDLVGEKDYNADLGLERARMVQRYLEEKGFPASKIVTASKGEDDPAAGYITREERAKNRRTVISLKK